MPVHELFVGALRAKVKTLTTTALASGPSSTSTGSSRSSLASKRPRARNIEESKDSRAHSETNNMNRYQRDNRTSTSMPPVSVFNGVGMCGTHSEMWKTCSHDSPNIANPPEVKATQDNHWTCQLCKKTIIHSLKDKALAYARFLATVLQWPQLPAAHQSCIQKLSEAGPNTDKSNPNGVFLLCFIPTTEMHELIFHKIHNC